MIATEISISFFMKVLIMIVSIYLFSFAPKQLKLGENMPEAIVITPVKDSLKTTKLTIRAILKTKADIEYYVFNDFSQPETKRYLDDAKNKLGFNVVHLEDITDTHSPNYKLVLETAQSMAIAKDCPLIIVESDVIVKPNTIPNLLSIAKENDNAGMVGAITVSKRGNYNYPYTFEKLKSDDTISTSHSISFCCTLITNEFLDKIDFKSLSQNKDWYDVHISQQSRKMGFNNYLAKGTEVLHRPHSSRPWKDLKYSNPILYYMKKILLRRDRI